MVKEKGRKEINAEFDGQQGKFVLVADLRARHIQAIMTNVLRLPPLSEFEKGFSLDNINYEEYVVQIAQNIIKSGPPGFDINKPDHIRDLDPDVWGEIEEFIAEHYPAMLFLSRGMRVIFGTGAKIQSSNPPTGSTPPAPSSSDGPPSK